MSNQTKREEEILRPAFASDAGAIGFLVLIAFALFLPVIITNSGLISRRHSYQIMPENQGAYSFVEKEIFDKKEDIDILFLGSSVLWNAVDTPQIEKALSDKLGRPARVVTFGFNFNGIDIPYTMLRDVLERRRVRLVVFSIPRLAFTEGPSTTSYKFLRYDEEKEVIDGLPLKSKVSLYASSVLRSPHDLLTIIRQNPSKPSPYSENLGANKEFLGMYRDPKKFERYTPEFPVFSSSDLIFSSSNQDRYRFTNEEITPHQNHYLDKMIELLKAKGVSMAMLNVPQYSEKYSDKIIERQDWAKKFKTEIPLIGIPPTVLFAGLNEKEIEKLHCDREHFNMNGNEYYTRAILPAVLEVFEQNAIKNF
jgi:hypothetical protein